MSYYDRALEMKDELVANRRYLHENAEVGLPFDSKDPNAAHCCGHDMHATMLLGAAKLLKEHENELKGTVKLMFQPSEETLTGSRNMLEHGILENPKVDAALA